MTARLPPLNSLRAFTVAARHLSFKAAAAEMHVTPAAISHQIKTLEDHLGLSLFRRMPQGLELTEAAQICLPQLQKGFACLEDGVDLLRTQSPTSRLRLGITPALATRWLLPRLLRFLAAAPDINLEIFASMQAIDSARSVGLPTLGLDEAHDRSVDIAIRYGKGSYAGYVSHKLFRGEVTPLCSPALINNATGLREPQDLHQQVFLHDDSALHTESHSYWDLWLQSVQAGEMNCADGMHFSHSGLALDAAVNGLGVVATLAQLAEVELADQRLVMPFKQTVRLRSAYFLVYPEETCEDRKIAAFRDWILTQVT